MRSHLFPSRTQKLSSTAPMVLHWRRCGRVGHRRNSHISLDLVIEVFLFSFARFDLTRISINSASRFYKILLCKTDWLTERSAGSRSGRIRAVPSERSEQGAVSPAGSRARSEVNSGSTSRAVRLIPPPAFEYSAMLSHLLKLSEVQSPQRANLCYRLIILRALRCDSPAKGASERSEAAPERELAQESKALLQQRSRMRREAVRSEVDIFHSKYCKSYPSTVWESRSPPEFTY